jgi:hypothetical protein
LLPALYVIWGSSIQSLKEKIKHCLETNDIGTIASLARDNRKVMSQLVRMAYDKETLAGWRAIKAVGLASKELVRTDYEFLRETVRKLLWSLSDESGGIGWSAPEILGEIVSVDPKRFSDIIPLIAQVYEVEEEVFRPGVVYALARIAETAPEQVAVYQKIAIMSLVDKNPLVKIYGIELVERLWKTAINENLWSSEYRRRIMGLVESANLDRGEAWIYKNDGFIRYEVGEVSKITRENLKKLL